MTIGSCGTDRAEIVQRLVGVRGRAGARRDERAGNGDSGEELRVRTGP